jgi:hypothetical protein
VRCFQVGTRFDSVGEQLCQVHQAGDREEQLEMLGFIKLLNVL